ELHDHADRAEHDGDDYGRDGVAVDEIRERADDAEADREVDDSLERHAPGERRVNNGPDDAGERADRREAADELLAELQSVRLIVEKRRAEGRAEPEEEDEARDDPDLAVAQRGPDGPPGLQKRRLVPARHRLVD